jgi:hypothetical protein
MGGFGPGGGPPGAPGGKKPEAPKKKKYEPKPLTRCVRPPLAVGLEGPAAGIRGRRTRAARPERAGRRRTGSACLRECAPDEPP